MPDEESVRFGRRHAHGQRILRGQRTDALAVVLDRLSATDPADAEQARRLLRRALRHASVLLKPHERTAALALAASGWLEVTQKVTGNPIAYRWEEIRGRLPADAVDAVATWAEIVSPDTIRAELVRLAEDAGLLADPPPAPPDPTGSAPTETDPRARVTAEVRRLAELPLGTPRGIPSESLAASTTRDWATYTAALRAAICWAQHAPAQRLSSRELAGLAFSDTKAWTPSREAAFSAILGLPFEVACTVGERAVLVGGPMRWRWRDHWADARAGGLWLGLPAGSIQHFTFATEQASGALVIENKHTFEAALRDGIGADLIVLWGGGYLGDAEVLLLRRLDLPVAVFADLDPDGIAIVRDVARRMGRPVVPLAMTKDLLHGPGCKVATPLQHDLAQRLADELAGSDLAELADLATAIDETGVVREQETMHSLLRKLLV